MFRIITLFLPVLFPSWRFFQEIGPGTRVEYWVNGGPWREATHRPRTVKPREMLTRLFFNADWNETLYLVSCAERLMVDPGAHSLHTLRTRLANRAGGHGQLEFRLVFVSSEGASTDYQSAPHEF